MADPRDERGPRGLDQLGDGQVALLAVRCGDPNFDELMSMQRTIQFRDHPGRYAGRADLHERVQRVSAATQAFLFGFGEQHSIDYSGGANARVAVTYVRIFE